AEVRALYVPDVTLRLFFAALDSAHPCHHFLKRIILVRRLAGMSVAGQAFTWLRGGNIDVVGWSKLDRILPVGNLIIVEGKLLSHPQPCLVNQERYRPVIGV